MQTMANSNLYRTPCDAVVGGAGKGGASRLLLPSGSRDTHRHEHRQLPQRLWHGIHVGPEGEEEHHVMRQRRADILRARGR